MARKRELLRDRKTSAIASVDPALLRRVAERFDVDTDVLTSALRKQEVSQTSDAFIRRADRLRKGLEEELGGSGALHLWLKSENHGLDGKRPVEFLEDGQIDVLERVQKALKSLQFG
jgi:hypothetical protein